MSGVFNGFGFHVLWQDWRQHKVGQPEPEWGREHFESREDADARKAELHAQGLVATIKPVPLSMRSHRATLRHAQSDMGFPVNFGMRLTR